MTAAVFWRRARFVGVAAVLLSTVWGGLSDGIQNASGPGSAGQRVATATELLYGVAAIAALWALFAGKRWLGAALAPWIVGTTVTAGLAPVVWGGADWRAGTTSGIAAGVVTVIVAWGALAHQRSPSTST